MTQKSCEKSQIKSKLLFQSKLKTKWTLIFNPDTYLSHCQWCVEIAYSEPCVNGYNNHVNCIQHLINSDTVWHLNMFHLTPYTEFNNFSTTKVYISTTR